MTLMHLVDETNKSIWTPAHTASDTGTPAALRLAHKQPWLGYVLAGMLWPPCFGMPAAWWPWWALVLWLINGVAYGWLRSTSAALGLAPKRVLVPWEPPPPPPVPAARASNVDEASAASSCR